MDDKQIISLYFSRAEQAITETARRYGRYCEQIAYRILGSREDSEECVNDTWLRAWNSIPPHCPERLETYLGKITRNLALNRYAAAKTLRRGGDAVAVALDELRDCLPAAVQVEDQLEEAALGAAIGAFLASLPTETRRIFIQRYWYLRTIREIAADLGAGESKIKMNLLRTREALRAYLEKEGISI